MATMSGACDGPAVSRLQLPPGDWISVLDCLCERFPAIPRDIWRARMQRGQVTGEDGGLLTESHPHRPGLEVRYVREVESETPIPFQAGIVHEDDHLLVADKPHFLPVAPVGRFVEQTLLARLRLARPGSNLVPVHRIDAATAGLVMFSKQAASRDAYGALFRERRVHKVYEALAPALPALTFPFTRRSRLDRGEPFFRMRETAGEANSETMVDVIERNECGIWRYRLEPATGRKHQLRMHMAGLGAGIVNDPWYPHVTSEPGVVSFASPLQLLARQLAFDDPMSGERRVLCSTRSLSREPSAE